MALKPTIFDITNTPLFEEKLKDNSSLKLINWPSHEGKFIGFEIMSETVRVSVVPKKLPIKGEVIFNIYYYDILNDIQARPKVKNATYSQMVEYVLKELD